MEEAVLNASLQNTLAALEIVRKEVSSQRIKCYALILGGIGMVGLGYLLEALLIYFGVAGGILFITGMYFLSKATDIFDEYRHQFKHQVIAAALKSIDNSMELQYDTGLSESSFINSQLFTQEPDRYKSQDQVEGTAGKTRFSFSEVHAEYKTVTQTKNGRQEHWHTILKGFVFRADFNKHFNGVTVVRPKDMGSAIGAWFSEKLPIFSNANSEVVKLEDPDFCEAFVTYSTDQIEARYILTPSMMERLCQLNNKTKDTISVSFTNSYVNIAFPLSKDYFEPPVFKSLLDGKFLQEDLEVIRFMYGIIAELDLNTRIWTKQ
ncbi:MAG: DUF3137 domain-containing protein [Pedobacter sp.]